MSKAELSLWDLFEDRRPGPTMGEMLAAEEVHREAHRERPNLMAITITSLGGFELCWCTARGGSSSGFRLDERELWVHAPCGRPTIGWLQTSGRV